MEKKTIVERMKEKEAEYREGQKKLKENPMTEEERKLLKQLFILPMSPNSDEDI